ncbi:hypothetical protein SLA2020_268590 [Shorea laevis]
MSDHKLEWLKKDVRSLSTGQQELQKGQEKMIKHMEEMFAAMNNCLDQAVSNMAGDSGDGSSSHNKGKNMYIGMSKAIRQHPN